MVPFHTSGSMITPGYVSTPEDLEVGASDEADHAVPVFLDQAYFTQVTVSSSSHLSASAIGHTTE